MTDYPAPASVAETFARDGYVTGLPALSADEVATFRQHIDAFTRARPDDVGWAFDIKCNLLFDWVYDMCCHPALLDAVSPMVGNDILLTNATFRIKQPGSSQNYGWHQDSARIQVEPCFVIAFLALSEQTATDRLHSDLRAAAHRRRIGTAGPRHRPLWPHQPRDGAHRQLPRRRRY